MSKIINKIIVFLALMLFLLLPVSAFAYTPIDAGKIGSITVSPVNGQSIGSELTLYHIADAVAEDSGFHYVLTKDFAASEVDLTSLDDSEAIAEELSSYAVEHKLGGAAKAVDENGSVTFDGLTIGLYLVIQELAQPGDVLVNPFIVSIPVQNDNGEWEYDVDANPKAGTFEVIDLSVKKVWNDGNDAASRPLSVSVTLYKDGTAINTVILNNDNGWSHTWHQLSKGNEYSVVEKPVSGYEVEYSKSGYTFTVTNTPKLPQTGQLNWPVPLLAGCGVLLFAIGWGLVFLKRRNDA